MILHCGITACPDFLLTFAFLCLEHLVCTLYFSIVCLKKWDESISIGLLS